MRHLLPLLCACVAGCGPRASAQVTDHVHWQLEVPASAAPGAKILVKLTAAVDPDWHLYSLTTPQPGPIATTIKMDPGGVASYRVFQPKPEVTFDANFGRETETYRNSAVFYIEAALKPGSPEVTALPRYQVCSATSCIPPVTRKASAPIRLDAGTAKSSLALPAGYTEVKDPGGRAS